jgi:tellurium resistance protein TerZ
MSEKVTNADLDLSCVLVNSNNKLCDYICSPFCKTEILPSEIRFAPKQLTTGDNVL